MAETLISTFALAGPAAGTIGPPSAIAGISSASIAGAPGFGSLLSAGLSGGSAFGSILAGYQQQAVFKAQATQSSMAARAEELKGRQQADKIRNALLSTLASQRAAFGARGLAPSSGTFRTISGESATQASRDIDIAQFGAAYASETERMQAKQYKMQGKQAVVQGYASAAAQAARMAAGGF